MKKLEAKNINIPGLRNSDTGHWQTDWETRFPESFQRVHQLSWEQPDKGLWTNAIEESLADSNHQDLILIGHSVGCATIMHWHKDFHHRIKAALLVAPSDVDRLGFPKYITGFSPMPLDLLPFPSIVVASTDDHVVSIERAEYFAENWGSDFVTIENAGHIETKSGFGKWEEGLGLVWKLRKLTTI